MESGDLFELRLEFDAGPVEILAEVHVDGETLELRDIVIYPVGDERLDIGAAALLETARRELFPQLVAAGFETLVVTGTRPTGSRPGRRVLVRIDLRKEAP